MKVREMLEKDIDVDVYDDIVDDPYDSFVGPIAMTKKGAEYYKEVLDYDVELNDDTAIVLLDQYEDWERRQDRLYEFFRAVSGDCPQSWWDENFTQPDPDDERQDYTITMTCRQTHEQWQVTISTESPAEALYKMLGMML